jgi:hypothetical protein
MTFGGAPCPSLWGYISETMADISNVLIKNKYWDPNIVFDPISNLYHPHFLYQKIFLFTQPKN